jgi:hypothetical protein
MIKQELNPGSKLASGARRANEPDMREPPGGMAEPA